MDKDIQKISNSDTIPLVDELIYNFKKIAKHIVIKNKIRSLKYEDEKSVKASDLYIKCMEGKARLENFQWTLEQLEEYLSPEEAEHYINKIRYIPEPYNSKMLKIRVSDYIDNYVELNPYYRELAGLPGLNQEGLKVPEGLINTRDYEIDISKYIHEMTTAEQDIVSELGIAEQLLKENPDAKYLEHIGSRAISIYKARKLRFFDLLYIPGDVPDEIAKRFKDKYALSKEYAMRRVYSEAQKIGCNEEHYDNFIAIFIIITAMCDVLAELPNMFIQGDIFDLRTIELIFESNGVEFFPDIPTKYQRAMVRNLNRLKKFKASYKSLVDISSIFGFDNIKLFKYYLLKDHKKDKDGNFIFSDSEDESENYELKFLKVPINEEYDEYTHDPKNYIKYDDVTDMDAYWDGDEDHRYVKKLILDQEFNIERSKYLSIDSIYSMTDLAFQTTYFMNMMFDDVFLEKNLKVNVPSISTVANFKLTDLLCYVFALSYTYMGLEDTLLYEQSQALTILGFNFDADLDKLSDYITKKGFTLKELGVDNFQIPSVAYMTFDQLMYTFTENKKVYDHVVDQMANADNKDIYDIYEKIYDSLLVCENNHKFFVKSDGTLATSFTDYVKDRNTILYDSIMEIKEIEIESELKSKIGNIINDIIYILDEYLNAPQFQYIWNMFPSVSVESVKMYMYEVINFFKSYKIDIMNINTIYSFDYKYENKVNILDKIIINYGYEKPDYVSIVDKVYLMVNREFTENCGLKDEKLYLEETIEKLYQDIANEIEDSISIHGYSHKKDVYKIFANMIIHGHTEKSDICKPSEILYINGDKVVDTTTV